MLQFTNAATISLAEILKKFLNSAAMPTPARMLRSYLEHAVPGLKPTLTPRQQAERQKILAAGKSLFARFGTHTIALTEFAIAIRLSPATIRSHFCDLDSLLAEILRTHLQNLQTLLAKIPSKNPKARRKAYLAATRTVLNSPTEAHLLLLRDAKSLPPDLAEPLDTVRETIGEMLAGDLGPVALTLLDKTDLQGPQIEAMLAALVPKTPYIRQPGGDRRSRRGQNHSTGGVFQARAGP